MTVRNPTHPSETIKDCLQAEGWSVGQFADKLGVSRNTASRLLNGHCGISPSIALALERIGWSNVKFWMRRQARFDLAAARRDLAVKS